MVRVYEYILRGTRYLVRLYSRPIHDIQHLMADAVPSAMKAQASMAMIFGLANRAELNGRTIRILQDTVDEGERFAVEVLPLRRGQPSVFVRVRPQNIGHRASAEQTQNVFGSKDLVHAIMDQFVREAEAAAPVATLIASLVSSDLWDGFGDLIGNDAYSMHLRAIGRAALISRAFGEAAASDAYWKRLCKSRWSTKFGFSRRWQSAMGRVPPRGSAYTGWRDAFQSAEQDAARLEKHATLWPDELHELTFDFRFWIDTSGSSGGRILRTGLRRSISRTFQMLPLSDANEPIPIDEMEAADVLNLTGCKSRPDYRAPVLPDEVAQGQVVGHPNHLAGHTDLMRFFVLNGRIVQWGYYPNLWPVGIVQALPTWGWQIANTNVCMRAIDEDDVDGGAHLFDDLLDTLTTSHNFRTHDGREIELPTSYVEGPYNRW